MTSELSYFLLAVLKLNIQRGEIIKKKKSNNNIFSKCAKEDNKYSVCCMDVLYNVYE
jgi:glutamine phosphoribosylpyrophosphate amidotransferase